MSLDWKKIGLLIGLVAGVIIFGYLIYYFLLKPAAPAVPPTNVNLNAPGLPTAGPNVNIPVGGQPGLLPPGANVNAPTGVTPPGLQPTVETAAAIADGRLTQTTSLTDGRVTGAALADDGSTLAYYDQGTGGFYRVSPDGQVSPLTDQIFYQVEAVTWAADRKKAILEYPDGANILYNFTTNKQVTLPTHWQDFDFSPGDNQIAFKSLGTGVENRWLAIANADGSQSQKIEHLGDRDRTVYVDWSPNNQIVATYSEDESADRQNLYFVGLHGERFKSATIEGRDFRGQWSTKGDQLLYSVFNSQSGYRPTLWIVSAQGETIGQNRQNLNLETWADKCTFADNTTVYCAVPQSLPEGAGIYADELDNSPTDIYKIDLSTGFKSRVAIPEGNHNASQLIISSDGRYLYFVARDDGKLYKIRLR